MMDMMDMFVILFSTYFLFKREAYMKCISFYGNDFLKGLQNYYLYVFFTCYQNVKFGKYLL